MTITKRMRDTTKEYTFIEDVKIKAGYVHIYYDGGKFKKIAMRAEATKLIEIVDEIKVEINYKETKKERDILVNKELKKPLMFMGEDNE